jgi:hypothetical protein
MKIRGRVYRLRLPRRARRNITHESTVTRPLSAPSANAISNFPEADFWTTSNCAIKCRIRSALTQAEAAIAVATSLHR